MQNRCKTGAKQMLFDSLASAELPGRAGARTLETMSLWLILQVLPLSLLLLLSVPSPACQICHD